MAAPDGGDASSEPAESELFELLQDTAADVDVDADADDAVTDEDDPGAGIEAEDAEPSADDAEARTDEAGSDESSDDATEEGATEDDGDASEADAPDAPEPATSETPADDAADSSDFATLQNNDDPGFEIQQIPANHTTIRIETGGARAGPNSVNGAGEGLVFYLHDRPRNSPPSADATSDLICTTGEDGACEIVVPNQTGGNILNPAGYWITMSTQDTAEWQRIRQLGVGVYTGPKDDQPYRFHTGRVSGQSTTHTVTADSWVDNTHAGMGWMVRATNPPLPPTCGLNTAVVIDRSTSIDAGEMNTLKGAAKAFVGEGGLGGTPSVVSLFSFGTSAEVLGLDISLVNQAGINQASSLIDSIPVAPASSPQYTNWDQALRTVANNGPFDLVIFVTDGDPTTFGNGGTFSSNVTFQALEHAVASANQVKAQTGPAGGHTRIIGLGIAMTSNSYLNLQALTGPNGGNYGDPTADADFYLVDEFEELEGRLAQLATDACAGTLTVSKEIVDAQGTVIDADPAGWEFTATTDEEVLVVNGGTASSHSLTTPDDSGAVNFGIDFSDDQNPVDVTVAETQQSGFELVPRSDGSHARCTVPTGDGPREVDVTNVDPLGFTVEVGWQDIVTCVVQNRATPSDVTVEKMWVIDGDDPIPHADRPDGWNAQLTLTGPGTTGATNQDWGTARTGYTAGDTVTINESTSGLPPGCSVEEAEVTNANGEPVAATLPYSPTLQLGSNSYTITNTVSCEQSLTLYKEVGEGGDAAPDDWTLSATGPDSTVALTGTNGVSDDVAPGVLYTLAESDGPAEYVQDGEWQCVIGNEDPAAGNTVTVPRGIDVECTVTNVTATLTLLKFIDGTDTTLTPDQWELSATPAAGVDGLTTRTVMGSDEPGNAASTVNIRPGHDYALSEAVIDEQATNPLAYRLVAFQRYDDAAEEWVDADPTAISVAANENATYRFVNAPIPTVDLPLTGGTGPATFLAAGGGVLALALAIALGHHARSRREIFTN